MLKQFKIVRQIKTKVIQENVHDVLPCVWACRDAGTSDCGISEKVPVEELPLQGTLLERRKLCNRLRDLRFYRWRVQRSTPPLLLYQGLLVVASRPACICMSSTDELENMYALPNGSST
jgi:hypothetical protein